MRLNEGIVSSERLELHTMSNKRHITHPSLTLFGAVLNSIPVNFDTSAATKASKPLFVFNPVPTAVPPCANKLKRGSVPLMRSMPKVSCCT